MKAMKYVISAIAIAGLSLAMFEFHYIHNQTSFNAKQKQDIVKTVKADLLKNPEFLDQLTAAYRDKKTKAVNKSKIEAILANLDKVTNGNVVASDQNAPITIVEFFDYQCVYCSKLQPFMNTLIGRKNLRFVFKETPIFDSRWEASKIAAQVGDAVYQQYGTKVYQNYHHNLFATHKIEGQLQISDIKQELNNLNIKFDSLKLSESPTENIQLFSQLGFNGTPSLIIMPTKNPTADNIHLILGYDINGINRAISQLSTQIKK